MTGNRHVIAVAPDSFKGCLTSPQAAEAMAFGVRAALPYARIELLPMADGGEGTADILTRRRPRRQVPVTTLDPRMRPATASYFIVNDYRSNRPTALMDIASASGLTLLTPSERDPYMTGSFGSGVMLRHAILSGVRRVIIGLGGSATIDCGLGMLQALGAHFFRADGSELTDPLCGRHLRLIARIDLSEAMRLTDGVEIALLADVQTSLLGSPDGNTAGAAAVFGPQKGLPPDDVPAYTRELARIASLLSDDTQLAHAPMGGAAGGIGAALSLLPGAHLIPGAPFVIRESGAGEVLARSELILTGEGSSDLQTLMGKVPAAILEASRRPDNPPQVCLLSGRIETRDALLRAGFAEAVGINGGLSPAADPLNPSVAAYRLSRAAFSTAIRRFKRENTV